MLNNLNNISVGIDISDRTIEVIKIVKKGIAVTIVGKDRKVFEHGVVEKGKIKDEDELIKITRESLKQAGINLQKDAVFFGLPENLVYTHVFFANLSNIKNEEFFIEEEIKKTIPVDISKLLYRYKVINFKQGLIIIIAVKEEIVTQWREFFRKLGVRGVAFDSEVFAQYRGVNKKFSSESICLLDIGATTSKFSIFIEDKLVHSYVIKLAGADLTLAIAENNKISFKEAERIKKRDGLTTKKNINCIKSKIDKIITETKATIKYVETNSKLNLSVKQIIMLGGSSRLPGLVEYFQKNYIEIKTNLGGAVLNNNENELEYIEAIGLALRGLEKKWSKNNPLIMNFSNFNNKRKHIVLNKEIKNKLQFLKAHSNFLIGILLALCLVTAGFYFLEKWRKGESLTPFASEYNFEHLLELEAKAVLSERRASTNRIRSRIIKVTINDASQYERALIQAKDEAELSLENNEKLWDLPMNKVENDSSIIFPYTFELFIYNEHDLEEVFIDKAKKALGKKNIKYSSIKIKNIAPASVDIEYLIIGTITVLTSKQQDIKTAAPLNTEINNNAIEENKEKIIIKEIGSSLNVRQGPGIEYEVVNKVFPGAEFELLSQENGWYEIKLSTSSKGWIMASYAEIKIN